LTSNVDIAIVGGGPAGTAAAITLRNHTPATVAVLESSNYRNSLPGQCLSPDVNQLLDYLGLKEALDEDCHAPSYGTAAAWGSGTVVDHDFIFNVHGQGWYLDRSKFDERLATRAVELGACLLTGVRASWTRQAKDGPWQLSAAREDGSTLKFNARFVIDATGAKASFARSMGARKRIDDTLICVIVVVRLGTFRSNRLFLESASDGWWYLAPMPQDLLAVSFITDPATARNRQLHHLANVFDVAEQSIHIRRVFSHTTCIRPVRVSAITSGVLSPLAGDGWIAAGDAAASFDPLSSAGIGHALYSGIHAARIAWANLSKAGAMVKAYSSAVQSNYEHYLQLRKAYYSLETRWPGHSFWAARSMPA
jgi:flavin-dependent dehydrogenase